MDADKLAQFAAKTLDDLDADADFPDDAELTDALLVLEARATDSDGDAVSIVQGFIMSERNVVGIGLAVRALGAMTLPDAE